MNPHGMQGHQSTFRLRSNTGEWGAVMHTRPLETRRDTEQDLAGQMVVVLGENSTKKGVQVVDSVRLVKQDPWLADVGKLPKAFGERPFSKRDRPGFVVPNPW